MEEFTILSNKERIKAFIREFKVKLTTEEIEFLNSTKDFRFHIIRKEVKSISKKYYEMFMSDPNIMEKEVFKQNFTFNEFKLWFKEYYCNNFYSGKYFGFRGIGVNIFVKDAILKKLISSFLIEEMNFKDKNIENCITLCRSVFDKVQTDVSIRNIESILKDATYSNLLFITNIESDAWSFEAKRVIKDYIIHAGYNDCCFIFLRTSKEIPVDKLALEPVFNQNINIHVK